MRTNICNFSTNFENNFGIKVEILKFCALKQFSFQVFVLEFVLCYLKVNHNV